MQKQMNTDILTPLLFTPPCLIFIILTLIYHTSTQHEDKYQGLHAWTDPGSHHPGDAGKWQRGERSQGAAMDSSALIIGAVRLSAGVMQY